METLVALVVASLFLSAFGRALSGAWSATRVPMDVVSAIVLARAASFNPTAGAFPSATTQGFVVNRSSRPVDLIVEDPKLAPAPAAAAGIQSPKPHSTPASMQLAEPNGLLAAAGAEPRLALRRVSIVVKTPLGRLVRFDSILVDDAR